MNEYLSDGDGYRLYMGLPEPEKSKPPSPKPSDDLYISDEINQFEFFKPGYTERLNERNIQREERNLYEQFKDLIEAYLGRGDQDLLCEPVVQAITVNTGDFGDVQKLTEEAQKRVLSNHLMHQTDFLRERKQAVIEAATEHILSIGVGHVCNVLLMPDAIVRVYGRNLSVLEGYVAVVDGGTPLKDVMHPVPCMGSGISLMRVEMPEHLVNNPRGLDDHMRECMDSLVKSNDVYLDMGSMSPMQKRNYLTDNTAFVGGKAGQRVYTGFQTSQSSKPTPLPVLADMKSFMGLYQLRTMSREEVYYVAVQTHDPIAANHLKLLAHQQSTMTVQDAVTSDAYERCIQNSANLRRVLMYRFAEHIGAKVSSRKVEWNGHEYRGADVIVDTPFHTVAPVNIEAHGQWADEAKFAIYNNTTNTKALLGGAVYELGSTVGMQVVMQSSVTFDTLFSAVQANTIESFRDSSSWQKQALCNSHPKGAVCVSKSPESPPSDSERKWGRDMVRSKGVVPDRKISSASYIRPDVSTEYVQLQVILNKFLAPRVSDYHTSILLTCGVCLSGMNPVHVNERDALKYFTRDGWVTVYCENSLLYPQLLKRMHKLLLDPSSNNESSVASVPPILSTIFKQAKSPEYCYFSEAYVKWVFLNGPRPSSAFNWSNRTNKK